MTVGRPRLRAQLEVTYRDGSRTIIASDDTWRLAEGPVLRNSVYLGERYDARREIPGWDRPGWRWNPYFGMFTFVPSRGVFSSPFGYRFWSPALVYVLYQPPRQAFSSGGGWGRGGSGVYSASHGYVVVGSRSAPSAGSVSSGSVSAAPAASPRTAGSASPRTSSGRGR